MKHGRRLWLRNSILGTSALVAGSGMKLYLPESRTQIPEGYLQLNWNENPYGASERTKEAIQLAAVKANRYPDEKIEELREKLAQKHKVSKNQILITAGSTEVLSLLGLWIARINGEILSPWPSFPTLLYYGERHGARVKRSALDTMGRIDLNSLNVNTDKDTSLVFICNPNNPTSTELSVNEIETFCANLDPTITVCIDEAYLEYSKHGKANTAIPLVSKRQNLIVVRTFSKAYGLAGMRLGYAISSEAMINRLRDLHTGWELSNGITSLEAAMEALEDQEHLNFCIEMNRQSREIVYQAFTRWGVNYTPSSTNFIYTEDRRFKPALPDRLKAEKILITKWPDMKDHIRISMSTPEDMEYFVSRLEKHLS